MHHGLIKTLRNIVEEARVPKSSIVEKVEGIRPDDCTRPGDFVVLDFAEGGRHLVIDGVVTTVYRNFVLSKVAAIPRFAAKQVEDRKIRTGEDSPHRVSANHGGRHMLIPFAMEDGGRIGAHGHATLRMLAEYAVAKGKLPPPCNACIPLAPSRGGSYVGPQVASEALSLATPHLVPPGPTVPSPLCCCSG
jgi:hypothetical protein